MIAGVDVGGSTSKAVLFEKGEIVGTAISRSAEDPVTSVSGVLGKVLSDSGTDLAHIEYIAVSGGRSRQLPSSLLNLEVRMVDEIKSIGIGGLKLAGAKEGLVVSMGTGTAIVWAREGGRKVTHIGGTGVGGGTLVGLGQKLLGISDAPVLNEMAKRGDARRVDLTVRDIAGGAVGALDADMTASNLGKLSGAATPEDIAAGILNMVAEVVGELAHISASGVGTTRIILVGSLTKLDYVSDRAIATLRSFGREAVIPKLAEFNVAVGAATEASWGT
jgi:type II pantothenate kinase